MATTAQPLVHGDFTDLAESYSRYREGYALSVRTALLGLLGRPASQLDAVDVGAGTGIWTRILADGGFRSVTAVEPNENMRQAGIRDSVNSRILWRAGRGEQTGLPDASTDLVSMASSFHWVDFDRGTGEFIRLLRPGGWFVALWNPRLIEANPVLAEIEGELSNIKRSMKRVSSAHPEMIRTLADRLYAHPGFDEVVVLEGRHEVEQSVSRYIGIWESVNDVRVQLGEERFNQFMDYTRSKLEGLGTVTVTYLTRAVAARVNHSAARG
ncbi:MAG: class I SAM-dependent methyltransferase [Trebonia sp.]